VPSEHVLEGPFPNTDSYAGLFKTFDNTIFPLIFTKSYQSIQLGASIKMRSFDVMKMLIDVGAKELVVAKDSDGDTALHWLCDNINRNTNAANKIKLMLQVAGTETILTGKNDKGKPPLDYATVRGGSNEIKALLQPRTIKNDPANASDDASNLVPNDHDNDTTATEIQDQLQAANQKKIADLENQIESQKVEHQKTINELIQRLLHQHIINTILICL